MKKFHMALTYLDNTIDMVLLSTLFRVVNNIQQCYSAWIMDNNAEKLIVCNVGWYWQHMVIPKYLLFISDPIELHILKL